MTTKHSTKKVVFTCKVQPGTAHNHGALTRRGHGDALKYAPMIVNTHDHPFFKTLIITHGGENGTILHKQLLTHLLDGIVKSGQGDPTNVRLICCYPKRVAQTNPDLAKWIMFSSLHDSKMWFATSWNDSCPEFDTFELKY